MGRTGVSIAVDEEPLSDDPYWPLDHTAHFISSLVLEAPAKRNRGQRPLVQGTPSADWREWSLEVSRDARWSSGEDLNARQVGQGILEGILRHRSFASALLNCATADATSNSPRVLVDSSSRLRVIFVHPCRLFDVLLAQSQLAPRPDSAAKRFDWQAPTVGPYFRVDSSTGGLAFKKNEHYAFRAPVPPRVEIPVSRQASELASWLKDGHIDCTPTTGYSIPQLQRLGAVGRPLSGFANVMIALEFGARSALSWASATCRRWLSSKLDRKGLCNFADSTALALERPSQMNCDRQPLDTLDGSVGESVRPRLRKPVEVAFTPYFPNSAIARRLALQLQDLLGVAVERRVLTYTEYVRSATTRDFDLMVTLKAPPVPSPAGYFTTWQQHQEAMGQKWPSIKRAIVDALSKGYVDDPALWLDTEKRWLEAIPEIPLAQLRASALLSNRLLDAALSAEGYIDVCSVALDDSAETSAR